MSREIGLSRLTVFELTDATTDKPVYDAAMPVEWVVNIDVSKTVASYAVYADNVAEISSSKTTGAELTIEVSSHMPPSLEAYLTGATYDKGVMIQGADETKKQFGIAYETVMDTGKLRRYFYTNCTISKNEQSNTTISDSIDAKTYSLTVNAIPLPISKELFMVMDELDMEDAMAQNPAEATAIEQVWDDWFTIPPLMQKP